MVSDEGTRTCKVMDGRGPEVLRGVVVLRLPQAGQRTTGGSLAQVLHKKHKECDYPTDAQADVARRWRESNQLS